MNGSDLTTSGILNPTLRMSSLEIAELTEKDHRHVMRDIRDFIEQGAIDRSRYGQISYLDSMNREQPMYQLDFEATMLLITGYDVNRRAKVINRWMQLERGEAVPLAAKAAVPMDEHLALLKEHTELLKQAISALKKEANHRKNFTPDEDARVLHLHGLGYSNRQIGEQIGRKTASVRSCLYRLKEKGLISAPGDDRQMALFPVGVLGGSEA